METQLYLPGFPLPPDPPGHFRQLNRWGLRFAASRREFRQRGPDSLLDGYRNSNGRYYALCSGFRHKEKTPSMVFFLGRDLVWRYHCFGCGSSGLAAEFD